MKIISALLLFLIVLVYMSLFWGTIKINPWPPSDAVGQLIVWKLRWPRIMLAMVAGCGLSISGVIFQALLRNPLADPYILGTSSGAALGGVVAIILGLGTSYYRISFLAFIFALFTLIIVYRLSLKEGKMPLVNLLLSGVIVNTFLSGLVTLLMSLHHRELYNIVFWLMGGLNQTDWSLVKLGGVLTGILVVLVMFGSRYLNLLTLGEDKAQTLGVPVETVRKLLFILVSLIIALIVSLCGMIGFVGLIIPHIGRLLVGPDHKKLIPAAGLLGAIFMIGCDDIARTIAAPLEIPIGVITALAGAPFFLYLLRRKKRHSEVL